MEFLIKINYIERPWLYTQNGHIEFRVRVVELIGTTTHTELCLLNSLLYSSMKIIQDLDRTTTLGNNLREQLVQDLSKPDDR